MLASTAEPHMWVLHGRDQHAPGTTQGMSSASTWPDHAGCTQPSTLAANQQNPSLKPPHLHGLSKHTHPPPRLKLMKRVK